MKNLNRKLSYAIYILLCAVLIGCTYEKDGMILKDVKGNVYRLDANDRSNESYRVVAIDTNDYKVMFK